MVRSVRHSRPPTVCAGDDDRAAQAITSLRTGRSSTCLQRVFDVGHPPDTDCLDLAIAEFVEDLLAAAHRRPPWRVTRIPLAPGIGAIRLATERSTPGLESRYSSPRLTWSHRCARFPFGGPPAGCRSPDRRVSQPSSSWCPYTPPGEPARPGASYATPLVPQNPRDTRRLAGSVRIAPRTVIVRSHLHKRQRKYRDVQTTSDTEDVRSRLHGPAF